MSYPEGYWDLRTEGILVDGLYWPATACALCGRRYAPYMVAVSVESRDDYCWGHDLEREALVALARDVARLPCPVEKLVSSLTGDTNGVCPTCGATLRSDYLRVEPHRADCVLQRAVNLCGELDRNDRSG